MKIKNLYETLRPFHTILKIFGLDSFNISSKNESIKYQRSYILLILIVFIHIVLISVNVAIFARHNYEGWSSNRVYISLTSGNAILVGVIAISNIYYEEYVLTGLQYLFIVENKSNFKYSRLTWSILSFTAIFTLMTLTSYTIYYLIHFSKKLDLLEFIITAVPSLIKSVYICQFTVYIFLIYLNLKTLNYNLAKIKIVDAKQEIIKIRRTHELLCFSGKFFNRGFSVQILLITASDFIIFVVNVYFCYNKFVREYFKRDTNVFEPGFLAFFSIQILLRIIVVSSICFIAQQEFKQSMILCFKTGLLHDKKITNEVNLFVQQVEHWNFHFDAMEFFKIDMTLVSSIIRSAMMFLLIFIQLDGTN